MTTQMSSDQTRRGFTLVELLVVIAIIGMLAGLMLPAVQQAREAGRRAVCVNNQRQVALACIGYDSGCKQLPGLMQDVGNLQAANWYYVIFPYLEQNNLYDNLQVCLSNSCASDPIGHQLKYAVDEQPSVKDVGIAILKCPSGSDRNSSRVNFVANAGRCNVIAKDITTVWGGRTYISLERARLVEDGIPTPIDKRPSYFYEPGSPKNTVFANKCAVEHGGEKSVSIEYISKKNGTSSTILTSENEDAGDWYQAKYDFEEQAGFCYGYITIDDTGNGVDIDWETPSTSFVDDYKSSSPTAGFPYWINSGKNADKNLYRKSRPSSSHPGVVVSTFCDGNTRPISDSMDKDVFKASMQPDSGRVFGANDFQ